jgi:adenylosuccinate synthase
MGSPPNSVSSLVPNGEMKVNQNLYMILNFPLGKGKLVDILAKDYDAVARFNGGSNAGHTVLAGGVKYGFHLLPCGILYPKCLNILGNGVVVNIGSMFGELKQLDDNGVDWNNRLIMSDRLVFLLTS